MDIIKVNLTNAGPSKLACVKVIKELTGLNLKDSKQLVDNIPVTFSTNRNLLELTQIGAQYEVVKK